MIDWIAILDDLKAAGMSQTEIGDAVGLAQSGISEIRRGEKARGPSYSVGVKLLKLHQRVQRRAKVAA